MHTLTLNISMRMIQDYLLDHPSDFFVLSRAYGAGQGWAAAIDDNNGSIEFVFGKTIKEAVTRLSETLKQ